MLVKDKTGTVAEKYFTLNVKNPKLVNTSTISAQEVQKGSSVTVNCSAEGGKAGYTYAVYYKRKTDSSWTTKQNYSSNTAVSVTPAKLADYDIMVKTKDSSGNVAKKYFTVSVVK